VTVILENCRKEIITVKIITMCDCTESRKKS